MNLTAVTNLTTSYTRPSRKSIQMNITPMNPSTKTGMNNSETGGTENTSEF